MSVKDCYDAFGGSYETMRSRIPSDEIIARFVKKFLAEPSFENLRSAVESGDYEEAFKAAHALKGVSANLSFSRLTTSVSAMTELLRNSSEKLIDRAECLALFQKVNGDYNDVTESIRKFSEE